MPQPDPPSIAFRSLAESDLQEFTDWLNRPHLRAFFQKAPITLAEVEAKYAPYARGERPARPHLALLDGRPFGYLQCYRIADYPDWAETIGETGGIGVDLMIFKPEFIGRGLGKAMLGAYLREVAFPLFPGEGICFIGHEHANVAGWRNSQSLGFVPVRDFLEDGFESRLYALKRAQTGDSRG